MEIITLKTRTQFDRVFTSGRRLQRDGVLLAAAANGLGSNRYGFMATTRAGGAVQRNRGRRWLRGFVREHAAHIRPGWDIVLHLGRPDALESHTRTLAAVARLMSEAKLLEAQGVC